MKLLAIADTTAGKQLHLGIDGHLWQPDICIVLVAASRPVERQNACKYAVLHIFAFWGN
jgi:hypothetical protein